MSLHYCSARPTANTNAVCAAARQNTADVRELIPEFFYLPEFLVNANEFELGTKHHGEHLDHTVLPAWAKGDVNEFIRVHREVGFVHAGHVCELV